MTQLSITITGTQIAAMHDTDQGLFSTPDNETYWSDKPRSGRDACTRSVYSMLRELCKTIDNLREDTTMYIFAVPLFPILPDIPEYVREEVETTHGKQD
jgi:hypothetical protein